MSNMSYCQFENTALDLMQCAETLEAMASGDEAPLSETELSAAKKLVDLCHRILELVEEQSGVDNIQASAACEEEEDAS